MAKRYSWDIDFLHEKIIACCINQNLAYNVVNYANKGVGYKAEYRLKALSPLKHSSSRKPLLLQKHNWMTLAGSK